MTALAYGYGGNPLFLKDIAASEQISEKYLSLIVIPLRAAGLIRSIRGAHGGYTLSRDPREINLSDVVEALEGETCLVRCVRLPATCGRNAICPARDMWKKLSNKIRETLQSVTIAELVKLKKKKMKNNAPKGAVSTKE